MADSDIFVRFGADIDPLKKGLATAANKLDQFGAKTRETANLMGKMAVAATAAGAALGVKLVNDSLSAIDSQAKLAKQLGTTSVSISVLSRAADMSGISLSEIEKGAKSLEVALGEAAQGTGVAVDTLERLGLSAQSLQNMSLDEKILAVNSAIKENIPVNERAAAAADLFGKKAGFAITQLNAETIKAATDEVVGFGVAVSDIDAAKIEAANDAMATVGLAARGVANQFTVTLAPILEDLANRFKAVAIETGGFKEEGISAVTGIAKAIGFLGDSFRGVEVIVKGLEVAFKGVGVVINVFVTNLVERIDAGVQYAMATVNNLIDTMNNIPGVNIEKLVVGKSQIAESMREGLDAAKQELANSLTEMNALLLEPLPSETIEAYVASFTDPAILEAKQAQADAMGAIDAANAATAIKQEVEKQSALQKLRDSWETTGRKGTQQFFSDLSTLTQSGNKKLFEIGKAAARVNVAIATQEAAMKAYNWAASWGGPVAGGIAAGAAIAAGGIRLQAINSTSFGGSGSAGGASASGGSSAAQSTASAPQQAAEPARTMRIDTLDPSALVSGSMINSIAVQLVELQKDGYKLVI